MLSVPQPPFACSHVASLSVRDLLRPGGDATIPIGNLVYVFWNDDCVLYVGRTTIGVKKRLQIHISLRSTIGSHCRARKDTMLDVFLVPSSLDAAEQWFIQHYQPRLNKVL